MTRLIQNDLLDTVMMAAIYDVVAPVPEYIRAAGESALAVNAGCVITVGDAVFKTAATTLGSGNLDSGAAFVVGRDYYVYICDNGTTGEVFLISLNSTFPVGYNANNSRKIGGFHYGQCRRVDSSLRPVNSDGAPYGAGWECNVFLGIVPRSVWTLKHRPKCAPEGMVYLGNGTWVDIYQSSDNGKGGLQSIFNAIPLTGSEGHNWFSFNECSFMSGKRLLTYAEFCRMAYGSPQGNNLDNVNAWTLQTAPARNPTGTVANAVSSIGARDAVGNVHEWLDELITRAEHLIATPSGTFAPREDGSRAGQTVPADGNKHGTAGVWSWDAISPLGDTAGGNPKNGNIFQFYDNSIGAALAGGGWHHGAHAGARAIMMNNALWRVYDHHGTRCACESM
jgi:hypothetical protein